MASNARLATVAVAVVLGLLGVRAASAAPGAFHEDPRIGYKVRYPKGWTNVAMSPDERWIVAKYLSDRSYTWTDPTDGSTWDHKPQMTVLGFVAEVVKKRPIEIERSSGEDKEGEGEGEGEGGGEDGGDDDDDITITFRESPYKDYQDYMKKNYSGGGWFISAEEDGEVEGVPVKKYEIKVEKLTSSGPKRIVTWVYHTEAVDVAVQFEVLEAQFDKMKGDLVGCLKSFRLIPRTKGGLTQSTTGEEKIKIKSEWKMTPEDRAKQRKQQEETAHRKALETLAPGWTGKVMGRFLVLNHADEKYAKKTVANAEAVWNWLDKEFAYVGPGEYMRRPIIRICKNVDEENAFREGSGSSFLVSFFSGKQGEIVTHENKDAGSMSYEFEYVNRRLVDYWFADHSPGFSWAAPFWLDDGLHQVLGTARQKGSTLEFKVDDWERDGLREAIRTGKMTPVNELVMLCKEDFYQNEFRNKQAGAFVRFLLSSKKGEEILKKYVLTIHEIVAAERKKSPEKEGDEEKAPETEEEEEERMKKQNEEWKSRERELLQKAADAAFAGWDEKAWKRFDEEFRKSL